MTGPFAPGTPQELRSAFREVMASVCTPVAVITAVANELPHGTTVSAFASLSMSPPMVLISLDRGSELLAVVQETGQFGLNVLGLDQSHLALRFARKGGTRKFTGVSWSIDADVPRIVGASGFLACSVAGIVEGGDHLIVLGDLRAAAFSGQTSPLTYHRRNFGTHKPLEDCYQWPHALTPSVALSS